jgi:hypothetical protein
MPVIDKILQKQWELQLEQNLDKQHLPIGEAVV